MKQILLSVMISFSFRAFVHAQDPLFTQFFTSPLVLNPAFTGCAKNDTRLTFTHRRQWLKLPDPFQYYSASADRYFEEPQLGLGLLLNQFSEGYVKTNQYMLLIAKSFGSRPDYCRDWYFNFAAQVGIATRRADRNKLLFSDQIGQNGPTGQPSQIELFQFNGRSYQDISFGTLFVYKCWMVGAAAYHLTQPKVGVIGLTNEDKLLPRYAFHLSYIHDVNPSEQTLVYKFNGILQWQGPSKELRVGYFFDLPSEPIEFGVWYANNLNLKKSHSIAIGFKIKLGGKLGYYNDEPTDRLQIGGLYDAEVANPNLGQTGGSMDFGIQYERNWKNDSKCPKPYGLCQDQARYPWVFH